MYEEDFLREKKNKRKGMINSIVLHLLLLLIAFFYSFSVDNKYKDPEKPYRVYVDIDFKPSSLSTYAHANVGKSRPKEDLPKAKETAKVEEEIKPTTPVESPEDPIPTTTPTPTPPVPTNQTTTKDESPVKVVQSDVKFDDPIPDEVPVKSTPTTTNPPKEAPNTKSGGADEASTESSNGASSGSSTKDDTGAGKGNKGTGSGADKGNDDDSGKKDGGLGEGEFDGSGDGIFGRKVIYRNFKNIPMHTSGKIVFRVCINRAGTVTYIEIDFANTTIKDRNTLREAANAAKGYKFEPDLKAPREQCGILRFTINNNAITN